MDAWTEQETYYKETIQDLKDDVEFKTQALDEASTIISSLREVLDDYSQRKIGYDMFVNRVIEILESEYHYEQTKTEPTEAEAGS